MQHICQYSACGSEEGCYALTSGNSGPDSLPRTRGARLLQTITQNQSSKPHLSIGNQQGFSTS